MEQQYVLSIDTELSDKIMRFDLPHTRLDKWPFLVQVAWCIYDSRQQLVKTANYFIGDHDFRISRTAGRIHGIDGSFLRMNGSDRVVAMENLLADVLAYEPLIVGHFVELDYHILTVECLRAGLQPPFQSSSLLCTMTASKPLNKNPNRTYLSLPDLYLALFNKQLAANHEAQADALATAACYFEMGKTGLLDSKADAKNGTHFDLVAQKR
ncbi:MAG: exonuclease domain-containing protein [Edaphocola sp.]